jgi:hypothetical protein
MSSKVGWTLLVVVVIAVFVIIGMEHRADSAVELWLQGNSDLKLTEIKFSGQERTITSKDPSVISYFNSGATRARRVAGPNGELSYYGQLRIGTDVARRVVIDVSKDGKWIDIGVPKGWGSEYNYWAIDIGSDASKEVMDLLIFLTDERFRVKRTGSGSEQQERKK